MTDNKHWIYLESLRRSGETNMYGAAPYLEKVFGVSHKEAVAILADWMKNYKREDYEDIEDTRFCSVCGKPLSEGFVIRDGEDYYCSYHCMQKDMTYEEYLDLCHRDEAYWTNWEGSREPF